MKELIEYVCESIENNLKYEFPKMYETHPELLWKFWEEYIKVNGLIHSTTPTDGMISHIQSRLMEHFDEGETE